MIEFIRINLGAIEDVEDALRAWEARWTNDQLHPRPEIGSGWNVGAVAEDGRREGEAVIRLPEPLAGSYLAEFGHAAVPEPEGMDQARREAWVEANRMEAHAVTIPKGVALRVVYEQTSGSLLDLAREGGASAPRFG